MGSNRAALAEEPAGRAVAFTLSPGNCDDISVPPALPDKIPAPARLLADKGYDANSLRQRPAATKTKAVIPSARSRKRPSPMMPKQISAKP